MTDRYQEIRDPAEDEGRAIAVIKVTLFGVECYLPSSIAEAVEQACAEHRLAEANAACPVYWKEGEAAVFDRIAGVFRPSWRAQDEGWHLVEARTRIQRLVLRLFFPEWMP